MRLPSLLPRKLDNTGLAHFLAPLLVVLLIALGGTYMVVSSHADDHANNTGKSPDLLAGGEPYRKIPKELKCPVGTYAIKQELNRRWSCKAVIVNEKQYQGAALDREYDRREKIGGKAAGKYYKTLKRQQQAADSSDGGTADTPAGIDPATTYTSFSSGTSIPRPDTAPPSGNIRITTYVDKPQVAGVRDQRLGNVVVEVERVGGDADCNNRSKARSKTNGLNDLLDANGKVKKKRKGIVNYIGCNTGAYKVTVVGRSGYKILSQKTKDVNVTDDNTAEVSFVLQKKAKKQ